MALSLLPARPFLADVPGELFFSRCRRVYGSLRWTTAGGPLDALLYGECLCDGLLAGGPIPAAIEIPQLSADVVRLVRGADHPFFPAASLPGLSLLLARR